MQAAKLKEHPAFSLMKQTDLQTRYYMQMPLWLFSDPRYADMNLDAKVTYTFLLNRFQLSRRKGWVNERGEVFVIFPRLSLAKELRICEKRVTAAFRKLAEAELIWEKRCGRGDANQIYLAKVEPMEDPDYQCAPFLMETEENGGSKTADWTVLAQEEEWIGEQEPQKWRFQNRQTGRFKTAGPTALEPQDRRSSKKEERKKEQSQKKIRPSVYDSSLCGRTAGQKTDTAEEELLMGILGACELDSFGQETAEVFENAIERLFYSTHFRVGNAVLPQSRIRAKLLRLNHIVLREAERKLASNCSRDVKNSTAYTMATIFNCIAESAGDLLVDPYLNSLRAPPERG